MVTYQRHIVPLMVADPPVPPQFAEADADGPPTQPPADPDVTFIGP